jgi:hypothetical protein
MRWNQGRADIDRLLQDRRFERVPADREFADRLVGTGRTKLVTAARDAQSDPDSAYEALYGAARLALVAILENQGLRPTSKGGHIATYEAVRAQLDPPLGKIIKPFDRLRIQRHAVDYPTASTPQITTADVLRDLPVAAAIVDLAADVLDQMDVF